MDEWHDPLDEVLDEALESYGRAPERQGLEQRILLRVTERAARKYSARSLVMAVGSVAALIAVCLSWWMMRTTAVQNRPATTAMFPLHKIEPRLAPAVIAPPPATTLASAARPHRNRRTTKEPKLLRFPTPSPLTTEERALIALVTHNPKEIPRDLTSLGGPIQPIEIAAVEIKPIQFDSDTKEK